MDTDKRDICDELSDEADLCRNDGADDIAGLLDESRETIIRMRIAINSLPAVLAEYGVVPYDAVHDADDYDDGYTLRRINRAARFMLGPNGLRNRRDDAPLED